jgi:hypothetical protein
MPVFGEGWESRKVHEGRLREVFRFLEDLRSFRLLHCFSNKSRLQPIISKVNKAILDGQASFAVARAIARCTW